MKFLIVLRAGSGPQQDRVMALCFDNVLAFTPSTNPDYGSEVIMVGDTWYGLETTFEEILDAIGVQR